MTASMCISTNEYPGGVLCVDSGLMRDRMAACYLLEAESEVAIIETGVHASVARLLQVLEMRGWERKQVRYVIATHVHLDHAGGVGGLMQALPGAEFLVHPRGAKHMIDPSRLESSARDVYGDEEFEATYGTLIPVDAGRVRQMADGDTVTVGKRKLEFMDAPGHASHHFCVWDEKTRGWFSGDNFGLAYRELKTGHGEFIFPTTTPIDFNPTLLKATVEKLIARDPEWMYLTHYGRVGGVEALAARLLAGIDVIVEIAERHEHGEDRVQHIGRDIGEWLYDAVRAHGVDMPDEALREILQPDIELNTQGADVWLTRRQKRREQAS